MDIKKEFVYAVIVDNIVKNIIISENSDDQDILSLILPDSEIIISNEVTGYPYIGGTLYNGIFRIPKPYDSWIWDEDESCWKAPKQYPQDSLTYIWNESIQDWDQITLNT